MDDQWLPIPSETQQFLDANFASRRRAVSVLTGVEVEDGKINISVATMCVPSHGILLGVLRVLRGYTQKEAEDLYPTKRTGFSFNIPGRDQSIGVAGVFMHDTGQNAANIQDDSIIALFPPDDSTKDQLQKEFVDIILAAEEAMIPALNELQQVPNRSRSQNCNVEIIV